MPKTENVKPAPLVFAFLIDQMNLRNRGRETETEKKRQ